MNDPEELKNALVDLTRELVSFRSSVSRPAERERCHAFIKDHLASLEKIDVQSLRKNNIPSLLALPEGISSPDVLLCGHLDVIDHARDDVYHSRVDEGRIYGPGAGDMKGALAILLEVFRNCHAAHPGASLGLLVTADEETGGDAGVRYVFNERALRCGTVLIPDGGSLAEITIEEKGVVEIRLTYRGHSAHAARPWLSENPLEHVLDAITSIRNAFRESVDSGDHWQPTCALTMLGTPNRTPNRIPGEAFAVLDIRFPAPMTATEMLEKVREVLPPGIALETGLLAQPTCLSPDPLFVEVAGEVSGMEVRMIREHGASDARFVTACGIPVVVSRPTVGNLHAEDEWVDIDSMVSFYEMYEVYLERKLN